MPRLSDPSPKRRFTIMARCGCLALMSFSTTAVTGQSRTGPPLAQGNYVTNGEMGTLQSADGGRSYSLILGDGSVVYGRIDRTTRTGQILWSGLWARRPASVRAMDNPTQCSAERPGRIASDPILGFATPYWGRFLVTLAPDRKSFSGFSVTCDQQIPKTGLPEENRIRGKWVGAAR